MEFLYIYDVFTKLDDLTRPKSITQAQKRIIKPKLTFPLIGQVFPTVWRLSREEVNIGSGTVISDNLRFKALIQGAP